MKAAGDSPNTELKFIVDHNVGKLATWLRTIGYDTLFFNGSDDSMMVAKAVREGRVILTRDTEIMKRRVITNGRLKAVLIASEEPWQQMKQVIDTLNLNCQFRPFTRCLECNQPLVQRSPEEVKELVPPYVFKTQSQYMQCPACQRVYWQGTHWQAMKQRLQKLSITTTNSN